MNHVPEGNIKRHLIPAYGIALTNFKVSNKASIFVCRASKVSNGAILSTLNQMGVLITRFTGAFHINLFMVVG